MKCIEEEEERITSLLEMAHMMDRLILVATLICLNTAMPSLFFDTEDLDSGDVREEPSEGINSIFLK